MDLNRVWKPKQNYQTLRTSASGILSNGWEKNYTRDYFIKSQNLNVDVTEMKIIDVSKFIYTLKCWVIYSDSVSHFWCLATIVLFYFSS